MVEASHPVVYYSLSQVFSPIHKLNSIRVSFSNKYISEIALTRLVTISIAA